MIDIPLPRVIMPMSAPTPTGGIFWSDEPIPNNPNSPMGLAEHMILDCWTNNCMQLTEDKIKDCKLVIDLGACAGAFSLFACSLDPNVKVLAVESNPRNFALLVKNIRDNGLEGRIFPINIGIYKTKGVAYTIDNITGSCIRPDKPRPTNQHTFDVRLMGLDDLFRDYKIERCGFLKVDIEGCEWGAFDSVSDDTLSRCDNISIEVHPEPGQPELRGELITKLKLTHNVIYREAGLIEGARKDLK